MRVCCATPAVDSSLVLHLPQSSIHLEPRPSPALCWCTRYVGIQPVSYPVARNVVVLACVWSMCLFHAVARRTASTDGNNRQAAVAHARSQPSRGRTMSKANVVRPSTCVTCNSSNVLCCRQYCVVCRVGYPHAASRVGCLCIRFRNSLLVSQTANPPVGLIVNLVEVWKAKLRRLVKRVSSIVFVVVSYAFKWSESGVRVIVRPRALHSGTGCVA